MTADRPRTFLSATWRYLAMANFVVDPDLLEPHVPTGTQLDTHDGHTYVSLVAFRFLQTRVLGVPVPLHRDFDEVNLRFYVRRESGDELRRGVVFLREAVPRRAISFVANAMYNEPYVSVPMRSVVPVTDVEDPGRVTYEWKGAGAWNRFSLRAAGPSFIPPDASHGQFITEHYWGYTRQRDASTIEYRVAHEPWRIWDAQDVEISGELASFYGPAFGPVLSQPPASAFLARGSPVTVHRPTPL